MNCQIYPTNSYDNNDITIYRWSWCCGHDRASRFSEWRDFQICRHQGEWRDPRLSYLVLCKSIWVHKPPSSLKNVISAHLIKIVVTELPLALWCCCCIFNWVRLSVRILHLVLCGSKLQYALCPCAVSQDIESFEGFVVLVFVLIAIPMLPLHLACLEAWFSFPHRIAAPPKAQMLVG